MIPSSRHSVLELLERADAVRLVLADLVDVDRMADPGDGREDLEVGERLVLGIPGRGPGVGQGWEKGRRAARAGRRPGLRSRHSSRGSGGSPARPVGRRQAGLPGHRRRRPPATGGRNQSKRSPSHGEHRRIDLTEVGQADRLARGQVLAAPLAEPDQVLAPVEIAVDQAGPAPGPALPRPS